MSKLILIMFILSLGGCITHKDLAKVERNAYENAVQLQNEAKVEQRIKEAFNNEFMRIRVMTDNKLMGYSSRVEIEESLANQHEGTTILVIFSEQDGWQVIERKFIATVDDDLFEVRNLALDKDPFE